MKVNTSKTINSYIQGQQFVARVLLILWLLASVSLATADDKTLQLLHQAAKEQDPTLRQASAFVLANLATADEKTLQFLHKAAKGQYGNVCQIALAALKTLEPAPQHCTQKKSLCYKSSLSKQLQPTMCQG